jgi:hypothetical protein
MISILGNKVARGFTRRPDFKPNHFTRFGLHVPTVQTGSKRM